jgi:hypothetical protein
MGIQKAREWIECAKSSLALARDLVGGGYICIRYLRRVEQSLGQALAELDADGWVSVEERLPESGQVVDVWHRYSWSGSGSRHTNYRYVRAFNGDADNNFWSPVGAGVMCLRNVTHWRPLPAPPGDKR